MGVEVRSTGGDVSVRCTGWTRWTGIVFASLVGLFVGGGGVAGAVAEGAWGPALFVGLFGLVLVHLSLARSTATVTANHQGLRCRSGLLHYRVAVADVREIRVVGPNGRSYLVLVVTRATGRPRRIKTVQQIVSAKNRRALEQAARQLARAVLDLQEAN